MNKNINKQETIKILFLGESTTVGQGADTIRDNYVSKTTNHFKNLGFNIEYNSLFNTAIQNITTINLSMQDSSRWYKKIDTYSKLPKNWGTYLVDGVHPNNYGYSILSQILIDEMTGLILKIQLQKNIVK